MKNSISRISFVSFIASFFLPAVFCLQTLSAQYSGSSASSGVVTLNSTNAWNKVFITDRAVNTNVQTGSPFISNEWQLANIVVMENKGEIQNVPVRIDAKYNLIEIMHEGKVKVLHSANTYSISLALSKEVFVSNKTLGLIEPEGFFKVVYSKKSSLLCHYSTKVIEGGYNAVLDAGIKEDKMVIEQTYYIMQDGKLIKLEKNRKKLIHQFNDKPEIAQYIKEQHIMPKAEYDLLKLIDFIDSLS
jgi:hypothetical protein